MKKILKNTTDEPINLNELGGLVLLPSESYELNESEWLEFRKQDAVNELMPYLVSGDLIASDGQKDLTSSAGIRLITQMDQLTVKKAGSTIGEVVRAIDVGNSLQASFNDQLGIVTIGTNKENLLHAKKDANGCIIGVSGPLMNNNLYNLTHEVCE